MKKLLIMASVAALSSSLNAADYPSKDIQGLIQWGAGGSTDTVMRSVTPYAEKELGVDIIMTNKTGGAGAVATKFAYIAKDDGYTLLMGAENPMLYKVMGLGDIDYSSFVPVNLLARGVPILVANNDAPYDTFQELVEYAQANPKGVKFGSTGPGGLPSVIMAMLGSENDLPGIHVPFDGDGPALTALQGGAIDVMPAVLGAAIESIKAKRMKVLTLVDVKENAALPGVAPISETYPAYSKYLPWGPFFGVFVKAGTPDDVVEKLKNAYAVGAEHPDFLALMETRGYLPMNISGDEAAEFLNKWQSVTAWLVWDAGIAKKSPEEFGIPRP